MITKNLERMRIIALGDVAEQITLTDVSVFIQPRTLACFVFN
jgi:hypothetical protein